MQASWGRGAGRARPPTPLAARERRGRPPALQFIAPAYAPLTCVPPTATGTLDPRCTLTTSGTPPWIGSEGLPHARAELVFTSVSRRLAGLGASATTVLASLPPLPEDGSWRRLAARRSCVPMIPLPNTHRGRWEPTRTGSSRRNGFVRFLGRKTLCQVVRRRFARAVLPALELADELGETCSGTHRQAWRSCHLRLAKPAVF